MSMESELLNIDIAKTEAEINDTSIGISLLGTFFLGIIPVFYGIMGIYDLTFQDIQLPLVAAVAVVFFSTILSILHWEQNTQKLKKLYAKKVEIINNAYKKEEIIAIVQKKRKK